MTRVEVTQKEFKILHDYDLAMAALEEKEMPPPRCHFRSMEFQWCEYEEWWECSHCGHTKHIRYAQGEL
jgi:hypothetical protein